MLNEKIEEMLNACPACPVAKYECTGIRSEAPAPCYEVAYRGLYRVEWKFQFAISNFQWLLYTASINVELTGIRIGEKNICYKKERVMI